MLKHLFTRPLTGIVLCSANDWFVVVVQAHKDGVLQKLLGEGSEAYEYDLIVIGGGSGGLACSKVS